jgi:hypothetical protein
MSRSGLSIAALSTLVLLVQGCSGVKPNTGGTTGPVTVAVSPTSASLGTFATQNFTATVTGSSNATVTWMVNGVAGGNATTGTISTSGSYSAPHAIAPTIIPANNAPVTVAITAVSQASSTASGAATVTLMTQQQAAQSSAIKLGTSGGNINDTSGQNCCAGTLGSLVIRNGTQYILSNNHVLAKSDNGIIGDPITQPGLIETNCQAAGTETVAHLSEFFNLQTGSLPKIDAALAQVVSGMVDTSGNILLLGPTVTNGVPDPGAPFNGSSFDTPAVADSVAKSGRTTGLTCSSIIAVNVTASVNYFRNCGDTTPAFTTTFTDLVSVSGGAFSASGDSGSLIVTQDKAHPLALLLGGSDTDAVGNPVTDVLSAFPGAGNVTPTFVGGAEHAVIGCTLPQASRVAQSELQQSIVSVVAIRNAMSARDFHAPALLANPAVAALGIGKNYDRPGEATVLLFVRRGESQIAIPQILDGVATRVVEAQDWAHNGILSAQETAALLQSAGEPHVVYPLRGGELQRAQKVHAAHASELLKQPEVLGVGITSSVNAPGEAALLIYVQRGASFENIPAEIDGLRTRIRESSPFTSGRRNGEPVPGCRVPVASATSTTEKQQ